ncbi:MAG: phosphatase PAP2 family protein [Corallincola sp.]|nr:phosphatase PAP2 family protein [Corallincola sp.]
MRLMMLQQADEALFRMVSGHGRWGWVALARLLSRSGDGLLYPLVGLAAWQWGGEVGATFLLLALVAFAIERPLYLILKNSLRRHRPAERLAGVAAVVEPSDRFSLPSGHTAGAFVMATLLTTSWPSLALPLFGWAAAVGWSRVMLRVHFPADVLIGAAIGTAVALAVVEAAA